LIVGSCQLVTYACFEPTLDFRENSAVLMNALEVYLNEPVVDWVVNALDKQLVLSQVRDARV
jgi:hypothetical protein